MNCLKTLLQRNLKLFVGLSLFLELSSWQGGYCVIAQSSVCTKHERYQKPHYVSYVETYKAKKWGVFTKVATRYNYRWEWYPDVRVIDVCCQGYTQGISQRCVPVCPSGCKNGECYQPNLCKCRPGFVATLNTRFLWMECVPHCPDGCNGGQCTAPGVCTCNAGYQSTEDRKRCVPSCLSVGAGGRRGCGENASCIAPDTCECHDGYRKNPNCQQPLCLPICSPTCGMNAFCASPDKCLCNAGYVIDTNPLLAVSGPPSNHAFTTVGTESNVPSTHCKPSCEPKCAKNSTCIAPNTCQCDAGYGSESSSNETGHLLRCDPICEPTCVNALCAYPNKCVCDLGYKPHPVDDFICEPVCQDGCVHARCVQPDHCECHDGYVKEDDDDRNHETNSANVCVASCSGGCQNGKCVAPEQCVCNAGYVLSSQETTLDFSTTTDFSSTTDDFTGSYSTDSTDYYGTDNTDYYGTDSTNYYGTDSTNYYGTDSTNYYGTDSTNYYGTDSTNYYGTDGISTSTIAPVFQQICQPVCEPECSSGSICIAPPNQCQRQSGINEDSNDPVADGTQIKNETTICDRNGTENGSTCDTVESAIIGHTASAIGTLVLLGAILGLGAVIYLIVRKRRRVVTDALVTSSMGTMEKLTVSDPLISTDESSYL